ncbi:hypothetical protein B0H67DRAFT_8944 [Lasiosphaeris hirsuta]|uniref:Uncharacterized protein n=1 Tax=Lasiosphaeris hirsuta TaxID=260670 RepID=A0AA40E989_9PEZI|nr:hypothetical protein B0H67DRAFT_8944 [Lasiosphaeris hirsuta]
MRKGNNGLRPDPPAIRLPDSAVAGRTIGGYRHIDISIPAEHVHLDAVTEPKLAQHTAPPMAAPEHPPYHCLEACGRESGINRRYLLAEVRNTTNTTYQERTLHTSSPSRRPTGDNAHRSSRSPGGIRSHKSRGWRLFGRCPKHNRSSVPYADRSSKRLSLQYHLYNKQFDYRAAPLRSPML